MLTQQVSWLEYGINAMFVLYFVILYVERLQSVVRSYKHGNPWNNGLNRYMYGLTLVAMVTTALLLVFENRSMFVALFSRSPEVYLSFFQLSLAAGCLLFAGMVHTEYTIPGLQFGAYGALIVAMVLRTVQAVSAGESPVACWLSLAFVVAYSMAIPVVYPSEIKHKHFFHIVECILSFGMVMIFTAMLSGSVAVFHPLWMLIALVGDTVLLLMRRKEFLNMFLLVFLIVSLGLWIAGQIAL